jgi:hypothetical protein
VAEASRSGGKSTLPPTGWYTPSTLARQVVFKLSATGGGLVIGSFHFANRCAQAGSTVRRSVPVGADGTVRFSGAGVTIAGAIHARMGGSHRHEGVMRGTVSVRTARCRTGALSFAVTGPHAPPIARNVRPPAITGTNGVGRTLTEQHGKWTNNPTSYRYRWQRCDSAGAACTLTAAKRASYVVTRADLGYTLRVQEIAVTVAGASAPATSAALNVVDVPADVIPPSISGSEMAGQNLSASKGTWTQTPTSFAFQWARCGAATGTCSPIAGATSQRYLLAAQDVGARIVVAVEARNGVGASAPVSSASTPTIATAADASPLCQNPSPCTANGSSSSYSVTAPDSTGSDAKLATYTFRVWRPHGLVNSPTHLVPLVFSGQSADGASMMAQSTIGHFVFLEFDGPHFNSSYGFPAIIHAVTGGPHTCGTSGASACDDISAIQAILGAVECNGPAPCQNIDTSRIYFMGSSEGATVPDAVMCDQRTSADGHGYGIDSSNLVATGATSSSGPNCPALGQNCVDAPSCTGLTNDALSIMWLWGSADSLYNSPSCSSDCLETGFLEVGKGAEAGSAAWVYGAGQEVGTLSPGDSTDLFGAQLGCPTTPTLNQVFGTTGRLNRRYFAGCSSASRPSTTALGMVRASGANHQPNGYDGLSVGHEFWNFWSKYPAI